MELVLFTSRTPEPNYIRGIDENMLKRIVLFELKLPGWI